MKDENEIMAMLEAMLFSAGDPVEISKLAEIIGMDTESTKDALEDLAESYRENECGIMLVNLGDKYQMCSNEKYADEVRRLLEVKKNTPLSQAALEVLAIIAYNKQVTKGFIEQIRGVDCSGTISSLIQKGLIEENGRLDLPGKPLVYSTTDRFLRCFSLDSLDDLPDLPEAEKDNISRDAETQTSLFSGAEKTSGDGGARGVESESKD